MRIFLSSFFLCALFVGGALSFGSTAEAQFSSEQAIWESYKMGEAAAGCTPYPRTFAGLAGFIICYINRIVPLLFGLALLIFFWGIVKYIASGGEHGKEGGRDLMVWGVIGLFVMASIFGILKILTNTFL